MRADDNTCHIKAPGCTGRFDALHEALKRSAGGSPVPGSERAIRQKQHFIRSCNYCNEYVEDHPREAFEKGWTVSRHARRAQ